MEQFIIILCIVTIYVVYIKIKRRNDKNRITNYFLEKEFQILKIEPNHSPFGWASKGNDNFYTVVIKKGKKIKCCLAGTTLFSGVNWDYTNKVNFCCKCGEIYNEEYYQCPECGINFTK